MNQALFNQLFQQLFKPQSEPTRGQRQVAGDVGKQFGYPSVTNSPAPTSTSGLSVQPRQSLPYEWATPQGTENPQGYPAGPGMAGYNFSAPLTANPQLGQSQLQQGAVQPYNTQGGDYTRGNTGQTLQGGFFDPTNLGAASGYQTGTGQQPKVTATSSQINQLAKLYKALFR